VKKPRKKEIQKTIIITMPLTRVLLLLFYLLRRFPALTRRSGKKKGWKHYLQLQSVRCQERKMKLQIRK
jgi:hypothetical protein